MVDAGIRILCTGGQFKNAFSAMTRSLVTLAGQKLGVQAPISDAQRHVASPVKGYLNLQLQWCCGIRAPKHSSRTSVSDAIAGVLQISPRSVHNPRSCRHCNNGRTRSASRSEVSTNLGIRR